MLPKKLEQLVPQSVWATTEWHSFVDDDLNDISLNQMILPQTETSSFIMVLTREGCQFMAQPNPTDSRSHISIVFSIINIGIYSPRQLYAWREFPTSREPSWENPWKLQPAKSQLKNLQDMADKLRKKIDEESE